MAKINTLNYQTVASWNGSQDLFVVEQPDGTKVATPAMVKQYVLNNMDEVPTQDSNNPVKSGGIFSTVDDIYSVMGQNGAKNLIPYPYYEKTHVDSGITWTDNGDGTVTANGTATATSYFLSTSRTLGTNMADSLIEGERYILTGCPTGGSNQKYDVFINETYNSAEVGLAFDYGNGATFTLNHKTENNYGLGLRIRSGQTVSNLTFKPMLRLASDTDDTYQPYAKTNKELTEVIGDLSQTGLTGDSVAEQLETAKNQIAALAVKTYSDTAIRTVAANSFITFTITLNDSVLNAVVGYSVSDSVKCVPAICAFQSNKVVTMRVVNTANSEQGFKVSLYYI